MKCEEKKQFRTAEKAAKGVEKANKAYQNKLYYYQCHQCKYWHLSSNSPQKEQLNARRRQKHRVEKEAEHWEQKLKKTKIKNCTVRVKKR